MLGLAAFMSGGTYSECASALKDAFYRYNSAAGPRNPKVLLCAALVIDQSSLNCSAAYANMIALGGCV